MVPADDALHFRRITRQLALEELYEVFADPVEDGAGFLPIGFRPALHLLPGLRDGPLHPIAETVDQVLLVRGLLFGAEARE